MKKLMLALIITMLLFSSSAMAFTMSVENTTERTLIFNFIWLECDWEGFPPATSMWLGEIQAGETLTSDTERVAGKYAFIWRGVGSDRKTNDRYFFAVSDLPGILTIIYGQEPSFAPIIKKGD